MGYKNNHACATFVSFIAKEQKIVYSIPNQKSVVFLAFKQMPALELWSSELFLITYYDAFAKDGAVHIRTKAFIARHFDSGEGLFVSLKEK